MAGVTGDTGLAGVTGDTGLAGVTGDTGLAGTTGYTGATGTVYYSVGNWVASSYNPNTLAISQVNYNTYVSIVTTVNTGLDPADDPTEWTLFLVGGTTGATGFTGFTGFTGDTGLAGVTGDTGLAGVTGDTGATGLAGVTGDTGLAGVTGDTGLVGATGDTGTAGTGLVGSSFYYNPNRNSFVADGSYWYYDIAISGMTSTGCVSAVLTSGVPDDMSSAWIMASTPMTDNVRLYFATRPSVEGVASYGFTVTIYSNSSTKVNLNPS